MSKTLITGANGFVGQHLCQQLANQGRQIIAGVRKPETICANNSAEYPFISCDLNNLQPLALQGVDTLVHTAARVHIMNDNASNPLAAFRKTNVDGTLALARKAAADGVKRFVFLSSIKVNGEQSGEKPFSADCPASPQDSYAQSKWEAEQRLWEITGETGLEVVIIRPPLIYGPGVKGNLQTLARWISRGWPLPLGSIHNHRDLVSLDNLCDLIRVCLDHPAAPGRTFLVSDGQALSTTQLVRQMAKSMESPARLLPIPARLIEIAANTLGRPALSERLLGNLEVDISATCQRLDWRPPVSVEEGFDRAFGRQS